MNSLGISRQYVKELTKYYMNGHSDYSVDNIRSFIYSFVAKAEKNKSNVNDIIKQYLLNNNSGKYIDGDKMVTFSDDVSDILSRHQDLYQKKIKKPALFPLANKIYFSNAFYRIENKHIKNISNDILDIINTHKNNNGGDTMLIRSSMETRRKYENNKNELLAFLYNLYKDGRILLKLIYNEYNSILISKGLNPIDYKLPENYIEYNKLYDMLCDKYQEIINR